MSCLRCRNGNTDCFKVTHLSYQNDIRIFTECSPEGIGIALGIQSDLSLVYHGHLMTVKILDRIFQRDHMTLPVIVDLVNDSRQCGRFTASGWAGNQHHAVVCFRKLHNRVRYM